MSRLRHAALLALLGPGLAGCATQAQTPATAAPATPATPASADGTTDFAAVRVGETFLFECSPPDGQAFSFTIRTGPGEVALWLPAGFPARYLVLGQARAASGAKYAGDGVIVWTKADTALLSVDGRTYSDCRLDRARSIRAHAWRGGVDLRAVGNEPGWHLAIRDGERIDFVHDYGQARVSTPAPAPGLDDGATTWSAVTEAHALQVRVMDQACQDSMSGEPFPLTVTVTLDGRQYRGCGHRAADDLP